MLEKMIIGTAQFGLDYGVNSASAKKMSQRDCDAILDRALSAGIHILDTAEAYGDAIDKIADYHRSHGRFRIISKFLDRSNISAPLLLSLHKMGIDAYHTILAHKSQDLLYDKAVQNELDRLKQDGLVHLLGVSIYSNAEFTEAIASPSVDVIQFPYNLLDNMAQRGELMKEAKDKGKILHARSAYLQGMLLKPFPLPEKLRPLEKYIAQLRITAEENACSLSALALAYVFGNPMIDNVVMGQHSATQLSGNIEMLQSFKGGNWMQSIDEIKVAEAALLSPRNW